MVIGPTGRAVVFPSVDLTRFAIRDAGTGETTPSARTIEAFISFSADEKRYTTVTDDLGLRVRDRTTGAVLADSKGSGQSFSPLHEGTAVFTPDGRSVVAVRYRGESEDEELVVLDASTLEPIGGKAVPVGSATRMVSITRDGRKAVAVVSAIGVPETKVLLVDLESRRIVRSTVVAPGGEPLGGARNNAIARDGRMVGVGDLVGNVVIADAFSGRVGPMLSAHDGRVESISFAPDGSTFVTTGQDGAVKLWDTATQRLVGSMHPFGSNHRVRASFVTAGRVVIVDDTGQILEWDPRPSAWEAHACRVAGRNLTKAEWAALVPGAPYRVTCPGFPAGG
jgi:WD40 repeat protein